MSSGNTPTHKHTTDEIKTLLELPFRAAEITWRVLGDGERTEGETRIIPYAYRAAYMRRLDILFGPGGWTQSFSMTTVSNIQRSKKVNKAYAMITTGKIIVTSTITIEEKRKCARRPSGFRSSRHFSLVAEAERR